MTLQASSPAPLEAARSDVAHYTGEVVYLYAFDLAYEMVRRPVPNLLGQPTAEFVIDSSKRAPKQLLFYRPQVVRLPPIERPGPRGPLRLERAIKLLPVGAISITVRVPFLVHRIEDLIAFHDLRFSDGKYLYDDVRDLAEQVRNELRPYLVRPNERLGEEEAYTAFCIAGPLHAPSGQPFSAESWLLNHRREVASLLTEEPDPARLSSQETDESTGRYLSYYDQDLIVTDWDAALIIDDPRFWAETLHVMELANVQLAELEAYDRILDAAVERSYRDVSAPRLRAFQNIRVQRELREIRIDLARLSDELSNITKFFGDWHLARIYQALSARFHLGEWHRTIDEKLKTLDDLYQLLRAEQNNNLMLILETLITFLFIVDLIVLILSLKK